MIAESELLDVEKFKKGLREEDKVILEEIMIDARKHLHAASYASFVDPFRGVLLSIIIETRKELKKLEKRINAYDK